MSPPSQMRSRSAPPRPSAWSRLITAADQTADHPRTCGQQSAVNVGRPSVRRCSTSVGSRPSISQRERSRAPPLEEDGQRDAERMTDAIRTGRFAAPSWSRSIGVEEDRHQEADRHEHPGRADHVGDPAERNQAPASTCGRGADPRSAAPARGHAGHGHARAAREADPGAPAGGDADVLPARRSGRARSPAARRRARPRGSRSASRASRSSCRCTAGARRRTGSRCRCPGFSSTNRSGRNAYGSG